MKRATVLSTWVGSGVYSSPYAPLFQTEHASATWTDVTAQLSSTLLPDPNALVLEVMCEDAVLDEIEACPNCIVFESSTVTTPAERPPRNG